MTRARRPRQEDRRRQIVEAALEVFAEKGYRAATISAVAERVGITQQGVLHYFPSKQELLTGVLALRDQRDLDVLMAASGSDLATTDMIIDLFEWHSQRPGIVQAFTVLSGESVTEGHPAQEFFKERYATVRLAVTAMLERELPGPLRSGISHEQAAILFIALMDGLQIQWLHDPSAVDMPALLRAYIARLRAGGPGGSGGP